MRASLLSALLLLALLVALARGDSLRSSEVEAAKPAPQPKLKACWKDGEARGPGVLPDRETKTCPATHPDKSLGLCYPKCTSERKEGVGPLCWDNCSKMTYKSNGIVFCCDSDDICSALVSDLALKLPEALVKLFVDISVNPANILKILKDFREIVSDALQLELPLCDNVKDARIFLDNVKPSAEEPVVADK